MKEIKINDINFSLEYEGYYWYSNQAEPVLVMNETISKEIFKAFPFIIEGNLYSKEENASISIKFIDGEYKIFRASLNGLPKYKCTFNEYLVHDLNEITTIKMIQYWEETEEDTLLENMKTLVPAWQAFAGFNKK